MPHRPVDGVEGRFPIKPESDPIAPPPGDFVRTLAIVSELRVGRFLCGQG